MNLFIPAIATKMKLTAPWKFAFYFEQRNRTMEQSLRDHGYQLKPKFHTWHDEGKFLGDVTLPIDTTLSVSRIYIRLGQKGFDSITFVAKSPDGVKGRFWVKLEDANKIQMEVVP